uniref:Uncharacterized protein n=1 Tax=Mycena chlorophos TaxID=658473 RepID=A0ABQ0M0R9_MYCCL|nr:predicted protein [Mycena chlorophos]
MQIEELCAEILEGVKAASGFLVVALGIRCVSVERTTKVSAIQLRTEEKNLVFDTSRFTSRVHFPPSLRAILTSRSIIKIGCGLRSALAILATIYDDEELRKVSVARGGTLLELGLHAKLKGAVTNPALSHHALIGTVLKRSFTPLRLSESWRDSGHANRLHAEVESIWQAYLALVPADSVGLPLTEAQANDNERLVTIVHSSKPVAEGVIVTTDAKFLEVKQPAIGNQPAFHQQITLSPSRRLVHITKVLTPNSIHRLHAQTIQFISDHHGGQIVVAYSMLRTRNATSPLPSSAAEQAFAMPASSPSYNDTPLDFSDISSTSLPSEDVLMDDIEGDDENDIITESFEHASNILRSAADGNSIPTRVLDDAFHFMDRLIRLLSKLHTAFKPFCAHFSESIFLRDKDDEIAVRAVLEKKGIDWEWAKHAMAASLNRRIRRYIPPRDVLEKRLRALFDAYRNIICSTETGNAAPFFSKEANEMAERLLETVRRGFLSDPAGFSLDYKMYVDADGLIVYRTVRGTNSVEGGVHMAVRRVFGSLQASPELAEAILLNWIMRRNKKVGTYNRTGRKYRGHFEASLIDEITELAIELGVKPSFTPPPILTTRIATSETFGIRPISIELAKKYHITTLPRRRVDGVPHHHDVPVHTLTRLHTKATSRYRILQLRQRTLHCVGPVHTLAEYRKFRSEMNDHRFRKNTSKTYAAHEAHKNMNYELWALSWNSDVDKQSRTETDSNKRLYYKFPPQLEHHHKKVLLYNSQRSTVLMGSNADVLQPFLELLRDTTPGNAPPALDFVTATVPDTSLSDEELNNLDLPVLDSLHLAVSRNGVPIPTSAGIAEAPPATGASQAVPAEPSDETLDVSHVPTANATQQPSNVGATATAATVVTTVAHHHDANGNSHPVIATSTKAGGGDRCARCVKADCKQRWTCPGRGRRDRCHASSDDGLHRMFPGEKVPRKSEAKILANIAAREAEERAQAHAGEN